MAWFAAWSWHLVAVYVNMETVPWIDFDRNEAISRLRESRGAYLSHGNTVLQHENLNAACEILQSAPSPQHAITHLNQR